ncbi:MAG TPA: PEP/pyruvate-binding domain-containing protein [Candidatus Limnocylindria bacterium]
MGSNGILRLADVRSADTPVVGGKAAGLGELSAIDARVPDGLVLTADGAALPSDRRDALIREATQELSGRFAVRSSGIGEDGAEHSFAGIFDSVLDVERDDLGPAVDRVLTSAGSVRAAEYAAGPGRMAVIVQRMVDPVAAGVALTADPVSGDRASCVVTAVRGLGDRLVSGHAAGDEWVVSQGAARPRRRSEKAIDERQALLVAAEARRIAEVRGTPQDVEWAIDRDGTLWMLQARPMTALPPDVSWEAPARGAYTRSLRFGEWIFEPVTPLFESWLLSTLEERLHAWIRAGLGQRAPLPHHVVVNGWYFYSINWISPANMLRSLPSILWHVARDPRRSAGVIPSVARHSVPLFEQDWRRDLQPRYRAAVDAAEARVEVAAPEELPALIDRLADAAGEYFGSLVALAGAAYKLEITLARFHQRHLAHIVGDGHLPLLAGLVAPPAPPRHAVVSLDWIHAPAPLAEAVGGATAVGHARAVAAREAAEGAARAALASSPRTLRTFERLLADAQHIVPIREEQVAEFTLPWPVMRRAVVRIGEALAERGVVKDPDDVFFLARDEALAGLAGATVVQPVDVEARRRLRAEQARLVPPVLIGHLARPVRRFWEGYPRMFGADPSDEAIVSGVPASAGRVTGLVRVIRGPEEFDRLQPGEVLVAPLTAPAWTPLFALAAAVVTDVGSPAAHASIIAREYGIPAVVGCGDATARLRTGMRVTVDGRTGNVEPA